jgi:hypothetical protein
MTGFFGVGGGFVIVPALTLALGMSMPQTGATSLIVISISSAGVLLARAGTASFDWAVIVPFTVAAIVGSLGDKKVADRISDTAPHPSVRDPSHRSRGLHRHVEPDLPRPLTTDDPPNRQGRCPGLIRAVGASSQRLPAFATDRRG